MNFIYIDTGHRDWSNLPSVFKAGDRLDQVDASYVVFLHASDWENVNTADVTSTVGRLRDGIRNETGNAKKAQIVYFSGDADRMLRDLKNQFLDQLQEWNYEGEAYFVDHNVESPSHSFGNFISIGNAADRVILARDVLPQEVEVMNIVFSLLLDTYLTATLDELHISTGLLVIRKQITESNLAFDLTFWGPVVTDGQLDSRLSAFVNGEGLKLLDRHQFSTNPRPLEISEGYKNQLLSWFKKRHAQSDAEEFT